MKKLSGIAGKLTAGVIVFGILLGVVCSTVGYIEFTAVLEQQYNDSAYEIAETARAILNPDKFEQYLETGNTKIFCRDWTRSPTRPTSRLSMSRE